MISTHILDTSLGHPAAGVPVTLQRLEGQSWKDVAAAKTDSDGRHLFAAALTAGHYQLVFEVEAYLQSQSREFFYTKIPIMFKIENTQRKYHVPLLLNPFGYATYRGS
jgi:5-hydroxyisourate hydrolase